MKQILLISANRFCDPYPVYPLGLSYHKTYLLRFYHIGFQTAMDSIYYRFFFVVNTKYLLNI